MIYPHGEKGLATGFLVAPNVILTAKHVLENMAAPEVHFNDGQVGLIEDVYLEDDLDLAFARLRIEGPLGAPTPLTIAAGCSVLEPIVVAGFPAVPRSLAPVMVPLMGAVMAVTRFYEGNDMLLLDCITRGGCSGAPVLNGSGEVVGLVTEAVFEPPSPDDHIAEGLGFSVAIPASVLSDRVAKYCGGVGKFTIPAA